MAYRPKAIREEEQSKILMVLKAQDTPMTIYEIAGHPTLSDMKTTGIAAHLRALQIRKLVKHLSHRRWVATGKKARTSAEREETTPTEAFFVVNQETQRIELSVGGVCLPVRIK